MSSAIKQATCPHCGALLPGQPRFCDQCGREILPPARPPSAERATLSGVRLPPLAVEQAAAAGRERSRPRQGALMLAIAALLAVLLLAVLALWPSPPQQPAPSPAAATGAAAHAVADPSASPAPASQSAPAEDELADLRARRDRAYERYTRLSVGEVDGDVDEARAEFRAAQDALTAAEARARTPGDRSLAR